MFATSDGVLWSPALPRKTRPKRHSTSSLSVATNEGVSAIPELGSVLSPGKRKDFELGPPRTGKRMDDGAKISRSAVGSPSPNDPSATFPSFSTVLAKRDDTKVIPELPALQRLQYPPRAQVIENRNTPKRGRF